MYIDFRVTRIKKTKKDKQKCTECLLLWYFMITTNTISNFDYLIEIRIFF